MAVKVNGGPLEFDAVIYMQQFQAQLNSIERGLTGITRASEGEAKSIENLVRKTVGALGVFASAFSASAFVTDVVRVRAEFQKLEAVLTNSLGSNSEAQKALQLISDYVSKTPFELQEVSSAYVKLVNQGIKPTREQLEAIGDLAASTGKSFDQLTEAIIDAQTGEFERLKEFGIRASKEGDKVAFTFKGVTQQVEFSNKAIQDYIIGLGNMQGVTGATAAISATLGGQISNLRDAWTRMLNDIGQSNEGVFSTVISTANKVVENYQTVLDILKVLIITYGSYRAALIVTTSLTKGYTIAEILRYRAMLLSETAMKLLNRTMLNNPFVAITTAVTALVGALFLLRKETTNVKSASELLADAQDEMGDKIAETEGKIRPYLEALKKANLSENERLSIYNSLLAIDPKIVEGLNAKTISYDSLTKNVNLYLGALRKQIALETNKDATVSSIKQEQAIQKRIDEFTKKKNDADAAAARARQKGDVEAAGFFKQNSIDNARFIAGLQEQLEAQRKVTTELGATQVETETKKTEAHKRTVDVIDSEIKALKERQQKESASSKEYIAFQNQINVLEKERKAIVGETRKEINAANAEENRTNQILEQRKDILQSIEDLKRDAKQSGLIEEQSELDKVNQKYDDAILKISKFNEKVAEFNKKNNANVSKIGLSDIKALNDARSTELTNTQLKQGVEQFKQNLDSQRVLFEQYEEAKKQFGIQKANELFAEQTKGFTSYLQFLQSETEKLTPKFALGVQNIGDEEKFKALVKEINDLEKKTNEETLKQRVNDINRLFTETATVNQKRKVLETQYIRDLSKVRKEFAGSELEAQENNLKKKYDLELQALQNTLITESDLYLRLNQDILGYSRDRIKQEIKELEEQLKKAKFFDADGNEQIIPPALKKQIEDYIKSLKSFLKATSDAAEDSEKIGKIATEIFAAASAASELAAAFRGVNEGISNTLQELSDFGDIAGNALNAVSQALSGDIVGAVQSIFKAISGVIKKIGEIAASRKNALAEIAEFNEQVLFGEIEINIQYRERLRIQNDINNLTLERIRNEKQLIEQQKRANQDEFDIILKKIQQESFVSGESIKTKNTFISMITGFGKKSEVQKELSSLAGKSFEELEKLFATGQLTDKAKELFEQLKKLKEEGVSLDELLEENKRKAQEIFTGTTSDAILDNIVDGFRNGLRSAADFAQTFEDLMRGAMINSLKFQYLEEPLKDFFAAFAASSESDGLLTQSEISALQQRFAGIIDNANAQFQQLQQIAGINFGTSNQANALQGAIKGMTQQTADLLAGQFGAIRITGIDQLAVMRQSLIIQQSIENNTALTASRLNQLIDKFTAYENGTKAIKVQ